MTEQAKRHRIASITHQLRSHESLLHTAQSVGERRHIQDRIDEFKRDLARAKAGALVAHQ